MKHSGPKIIITSTIVIFILILGYILYKSSDSEFFSEGNMKDQEIEWMKLFGLDMTTASKLLPPVTKNTIMEDTNTYSKTPIIFNKGKKNEYIVPPLTAINVVNPLLINKKLEKFEPIPISKISKILLNSNSANKEDYYEFTHRIIDPRELVINIVNRDNERLGPRLRTIDASSSVLRDIVIDDLDWDWSDEIRGLTFINSQNIVICNEFHVLGFELSSPGNIRVNDLNQDPRYTEVAPSTCDYKRAQGTIFKLRPQENSNGYWRGYRQFYLGLSSCVSSGRRVVEFFNPLDVTVRVASFSLPSALKPSWLAHDPISDFILVPHVTNMSSVQFYDFARSYETSRIRFVREFPLTMNNGQNFTLQGVVSGVFSESGLLHLVSKDLYGVYTFGLTADNTSFELRHVIGRNALDDTTFPDKMVGIGSLHNNLYVLFKNDDTFDEDNLSIKKYAFSALIPSRFSWNNPVDVSNYYARTIQLSPPGSQLICGNCWAFATTAVLADRLAIINNQNVASQLSVTYLSSCDDTIDDPCAGNKVYNAYESLVKRGTVTENCWDYRWLTTLIGTTSAPPASEFGADIPSWQYITPCTTSNKSKCVTCNNSTGSRNCSQVPNLSPSLVFAQRNTLRHTRGIDDIKLEILSGGPVTASFYVYNDFLRPGNWSVTGDIYCHIDNDIDLYGISDWNERIGAHAIEIVGWGQKTISNPNNVFGNASTVTIPYWIAKNSWGTSFGSGGYVNVAMSNDELGINTNIGFDRPVQRGAWLFIWEWGGVYTFDPKR